MKSYLVLSSMGPDRPGLARQIAEFFTARGINIERSRGCVLGDEFGMVILTSGNTEDLERLISDVDSLRQKTGLDIHIRKTKAPIQRAPQPSIPYHLAATSVDHPGIIHRICKCLQEHGINIDDVSTNIDHNHVTGANVFQMSCYFSLPSSVKIANLKRDLTRVSDEDNIDIRFDAVVSR